MKFPRQKDWGMQIRLKSRLAVLQGGGELFAACVRYPGFAEAGRSDRLFFLRRYRCGEGILVVSQNKFHSVRVIIILIINFLKE